MRLQARTKCWRPVAMVRTPIPSLFVQRANTTLPSYTPANRSAGLTDGGSCHANAVDSGPARTTGGSNLRDHLIIRLRDRCGRHSLRRCCNRQGEARNSNQSDHFAPPLRVARSKSFRRWSLGVFEMDQGPACADRENSSPAGCAAAAPGGRFLSYLIDDGASLLPAHRAHQVGCQSIG